MRISNRSFLFLYLGSFGALVILSWIRYLLSKTIVVDDIILDSNIEIASTCLFVMFLIINFTTFLKLEFKNSRELFFCLIYIHFLALFMLPCISNDIFSFLGYADSFNFSSSIYSESIKTDSIFYTSVSPLYKSIPCVYGLTSILIGKIAIVSKSIIWDIFYYKILYSCLSFGSSILLLKIKQLSIETKAFLLLNPIWTIHGLGHGHTEVIGLSFLFLTMYFLYLKKPILSIFFFIVAIFSKLSFIICAPLLVYLNYRIYECDFQKARVFLLQLVISIISSFALVYLWMQNLSPILSPLKTIAQMWPTGSFIEYLFSIFKLVSPNEDFVTLNHDTYSSMLHQSFLVPVSNIFKCIFIGYNLLLLWMYRKNLKPNIPNLITGFSISVILLYSHRFMSWYLLMIIPTLIFSTSKRYIPAIILLGLASTIQDSAHFNHYPLLYTTIVVIGIIGTIILQVNTILSPFKKPSTNAMS